MKRLNPYSFVCKRLTEKKGERDTLATFLSLMLDEAEELFGPKLEPYPYMFAGIDFGLDHPQVWFRGQGKQLKYKYVTIRLSKKCARDRARAVWQLTHECVHLLAPVLRAQISVLEEGMACWYQNRWLSRCPDLSQDWAQSPTEDKRYIEAARVVGLLLGPDQNVIKRIRQIEPDISKITAHLIMQEAPWINKELARKLTAKFPPRKSQTAKTKQAKVSAPVRKPFNQTGHNHIDAIGASSHATAAGAPRDDISGSALSQ